MLSFPGLGLPALRPQPRRRCASSVRAAGDPARASAQGRQAATARHHRQRRDPADADARSGSASWWRGSRRASGSTATGSPPCSSANGYARTDTVADAGEYAVRGGLVDLFPSGESEGAAARLLRRRDRERPPLRSRRPSAPSATSRRLHPAAGLRDPARRGQRQALPLPLSRAVRRHRDRRPALPGGVGRAAAGRASTIGCPCSRSGSTPCSTISATTISSSATPATPAPPTRASRRSPIITRTATRAQSSDPGSYRPLEPETLYLGRDEWERLIADRPLHLATPFHEPESATVLDFEVDPAARLRAGADRRTSTSTKRWSTMSRRFAGRSSKVVLASYSDGARERLKGLLADHGLTKAAEVDSWQEALGAAAKGQVALAVIQLDHGFTTADVALLTEQDMLGDRLVRRRKRRKSADAFLSELATLTPGRPRRPRRSRHRPLRGPDPDPGRHLARTIASRSNMPAATSSTCRSRISTSCRATAARATASRSTGSAARPGSGASRG